MSTREARDAIRAKLTAFQIAVDAAGGIDGATGLPRRPIRSDWAKPLTPPSPAQALLDAEIAAAKKEVKP